MRIALVCLIVIGMFGCSTLPKRTEIAAPTVGKIIMPKPPPEKKLQRAYRTGAGHYCFRPNAFEALVYRDRSQQTYIDLLQHQIEAHNAAIDRWESKQKEKKKKGWLWFW